MKKLVLTLIYSFFLIIFITLIKNEWGRKLYKNSNFGLENLINKGEIDNLFLGSSMFRQGIDINTLETNHTDSYIIAYNGNQPVYEYLELEYLLKNNLKINNLYLDMYIYSAASTPKISDKRLLMQTDLKFKFDIWQILCNCKENSFSIFWEMFITSNNETFLTFPLNHKIINNLYKKGGNIQINKGISIERINELPVPTPENNNLNNLQKEYIIKIINLCKENDINITFIETPKYYKVSEDVNYQKLIIDYIKILEENEMNYYLSQYTSESINIINPNFISFDSKNSQNFIDMIHMSSKGRETYTSQLLTIEYI